MYRFRSHEDAAAATSHVASFVLPPLDHQNVYSSFCIQCAPTGVTPASRSDNLSLPKVFDLSPNNRLLCLGIKLTPTSEERPIMLAGTLYIPTSLLISAIAKRQNMGSRQPVSIIIPWAGWAEKTSWVDTSHILSHNENFMFGQRTAGLAQNTAGARSKKVIMFDFDQSRLKSRHTLKEPAGGLVRSPGDVIVESGRDGQVGEKVFCSGITRASRKYVESSILLSSPATMSDEVVVDDEHGECMLLYTTSWHRTDYYCTFTMFSCHNKG